MGLTYNFVILAFATSNALAQWGGGRPGAETWVGGEPWNRGPEGPPSGQWRGNGQTAGSPAYNYMYQFPLPIPPVATPEFSENVNGRTVEYYSMTIESFEQQIYPDLAKTKLSGYNGMTPGPTFIVEKGHESIVRFLNNNDSPSSIHLHGSPSHPVWDGWADDQIKPGQWKDYYWPHVKATSEWYHDHAEGYTATNAYYGQAGAYIIHDADEDALALPDGDYDIPLAITDKKYQEDGQLASPEGETIGFLGDIIHVNGQPWPYLAVEPRKYRFRVFCMSLSRPYDLYFEDENAYQTQFQVIASDSGLFGAPVMTSDLMISPGERYEVVVDFAPYSGKNVTLKNKLEIPLIDEYENTDKVMMFAVGDKVTNEANNNPVPETLDKISWPEGGGSVDRHFDFEEGDNGQWMINGITYMDVNARILAKPEQGSTEIWEFTHAGGPSVHPVHMHLVNFKVVSRSGGSRGVLPYESAGLKDVVLIEPGETVQVLATFLPFSGLYMFHCHNLIHEDNGMMAAFDVDFVKSLGYDAGADLQYADPEDPKYAAKDYTDAAFTAAAIKANFKEMTSWNPYAATQLTKRRRGVARSFKA